MTEENKRVLAEEKSNLSSNSDWLLIQLVEAFANEVSGKMSITLFVHGLIITGLLIGEKAYFEASGFKTLLIEELDSTFNSDELLENERKISQLNDTEFIHLKNAKFSYGNSLAPSDNKGIYWRGRLSSIDGFFLGSFASIN
jgi:hypothetical protein